MKTSCKRVVSLLLVVMTIVGCCIPSFAETTTCAHDDGHQRYEKTVPSTCKDLGYELWFCETCGQYYVPSDKWIEKSDAHDYQEVIIREATCVVDGLKRIVCSICGNVKSEEVIRATGSHTYVYPAGYDCTVGGTVTCSVDGQTYVLPAGSHAFAVTTEATHTAAGLKTCTVCGATEVIPKVDHEFVASVKVYPDKCKDGIMLFECSCGEASYEVVIKGADHAASDLTAPYDVPATCTESGWDNRVDCAYCGERVSGTVVPALGHNMQSVAAKSATCTEDGYTAYQKCSRCGYTTGKTVLPATGHNMVFSEWIVKADCVAKTDGSAKYVCHNGCGYTENRTISYDDRLSHNYEIVGVVDPTCTDYGYEYEVCKLCGKQNKTVSLEPLGHHLVNVSGQAATCTDEGFTDYKKCDRTGCTYTEGKVTTPALGHIEAAGSRVEPTCTVDGSYTCSRCLPTISTISIPALGHNFSVKVVKTAPTCVAEGAYQWKCSRCDATSDTNAAGESAGIIPIDPDAHQLSVAYQTKSPTCFAPGEKVGYCTLCLKSDAKVEVPMLEHAKFEDGAERIVFDPVTMNEADTDSYTERVIREATCYQTGLVAYKCKFCDYDGQYHWFFVETAMVAHTLTTDPRVAPGCTTAGKTARTYCTVAGCTYSVGGDVIAPNHDVITKATSEKTSNVPGFTRVAAQAPTCVDDGNKAYYECDDCGKIFTWNGVKYVEVTDAEVVVARLEHNIVDYKGYAIHCPTQGCTLCGTASDALCDGNGLTDGKRCNRDGCGVVTVVRTVIPNTDAAHAHHINVVDVPAVAATCSTVGYEATWKCEACGYVEPAVEIAKLAHTFDVLVVVGECTVDGYKYTYCTMCLERAKDDLPVVRSDDEVVTEFIKAPGHKNANGVILVEGWDCQHPTIKTKDDIKDWTDAELTCAVCYLYVPVQHNSQTIARVYAPTCSDRGYTITVCDDCGLEIVTNIQEADPNAHVYSEYTVEATYTTAGYKYKKCDLCGHEAVIAGTLAKKSAFNVKLEVFNPYGTDNKFVKSGIIGVRVILEAVDGETFDVTSAQVSFDVPSTLVYRSVKFNAPAGFDASDVVISAGINAGKCVVLANTLKDANGDVITMSVSGSYALAEVYFVVSDENSGDFNKNADLGSFSFGYAEPTVLDENYDEETGRFGEFGYTAVNTAAELGFEVGLLGDANGDGVLNAQDAQRLSNLMVDANAYDSALDVDKDGKLTMTDFMLLQGNIVGAVSDVDFYNSGLADGEKWN